MINLDKIIVTDIVDFFTILSPKDRFEKIYNRKSYGLSFCSEGQITYTHNGNKVISDKITQLFFPKGRLTHYTATKQVVLLL